MSRYRYTLYALLGVVTSVAAFFGTVRFLVRHPDMLTPIVTVFVFLGCVLSPAIASHRDTARNRMSLGCFVLPAFFVVCGFAFSVLILMLSRGV
jgi:uncharacterized membrane protein